MLRYRVDPSATLTGVAMRDDGAGGDEVAGDGIYSGTIPGRTAGSLAAFRIKATDAAEAPVTSRFPANVPAQECHVRWGDAMPFGTFGHYHLWSTAAAKARATARCLSITPFAMQRWSMGISRILYMSASATKAVLIMGGAGDFAVTVPPDDLLLGATRPHFLPRRAMGTANEPDCAGSLGLD